jgi:DNA-binding transcriptional regulator YdaS (Cro superfamily)
MPLMQSKQQQPHKSVRKKTVEGERTEAMDVYAVRRSHIARLIAEAGSVTKFAARVGTNPDYVSQVMSPKTKSNPGATLMRNIERAYGLPRGSLDQPKEAAALAALALQFLPDDAYHACIDFIRFQASQSGALETNEELAKYLSLLDQSNKSPPRGGGT